MNNSRYRVPVNAACRGWVFASPKHEVVRSRSNGSTGGPTTMGQQTQTQQSTELSHLLLGFTFLCSCKPCLLFLHLWAPTHPQVIKILPLVCKYTVSTPHGVRYELGPAVRLNSSGFLNEPVSCLCISGAQVLNFSPTYSPLHDERQNSLAFLLKYVQQTFIHSLKFRFVSTI